MNNIWTKNQKQAISAKGGSIIVSAAAGSGKTECLSERIVKLISDSANPRDINRLLMVTFTNSAAEQMKQKINKKLGLLVLKKPNNNHIKYQQMFLGQANICTVHSFCSKLIRENFNLLSISKNFKISDENEISAFKNEVMERILEEYYTKSSEEFINLSESINSKYDDSCLSKLIADVYEFSRSLPFPEVWFKEIEEKFSTENIERNNSIKVVVGYAKDSVNFLKNMSKNLLKNKNSKLYLKTLNSDIQIFLDLENAILKNKWNLIRETLQNTCFSRLPSVKTGNKQNILEYRNKSKKVIKELLDLFSKTEKDVKNDILVTRRLIRPLFKLVRNFESELWKLKIQKNFLEFSDLEHLTLKLLVEKTNENNKFIKTALAKEISCDFDEILIDEYQDTNEIQDIIFKSISQNEENLFVVGDVKQSIYSFRQARPEIFINRKKMSKTYDEEIPLFPAKISLKENFRSDEKIINFINFIFTNLMTTETSEINYKKDETMETLNKNIESNSTPTTIHVLETKDLGEKELIEIEANHIAKTIKEMVLSKYNIKENNKIRPVRYEDFCILLRSTRSYCEVFKKALLDVSIEVYSENADNFFDLAEVSMIMSFLRSINNPTDDISLVATAMSPIFGFTANQMALIREKNGANIYTSIKNSSQNNTKCFDLLNKLDELRKISQELKISKLIDYVYDEFFIFSFIISESDGENKIKNLKFLISLAKKTEESGYNSLSSFLGFVDKLKENNITVKGFPKTSLGGNAVKIMSIHRAKGLEFPICIVANCSFKFHVENADTLLHPSLGIGLKIFDIENISQYKTIQREAILIENKNSQVSEELRILYVAMTRAKEKLIFTVSTNNFEKKIQKLSLYNSNKIWSYGVKHAKSFGDWLLLMAIRYFSEESPDFDDPGLKIKNFDNKNNLSIKIIRKNQSKNIDSFENEEERKDKIERRDSCNANKLHLKFLKRFNFKYKQQELVNIPAKISVTELLNDCNEELGIIFKPKFLGGNQFSTLEIGSIQHKFLQLVDFKKAKLNIAQCISEFVKANLLTKEESENLDIEKLRSFFNSKICERIIKSKNFLREYHFMVNMEAGKINPNISEKFKEKTVILQGAVDCAFEENGKIIIVDYKTDKIIKSSRLINKYKKQLKLYKYAISKCMEKPVKEMIIYSFALEKSLVLCENE
ncbi:MAG: helicase-exonuclease AddAB subunit AddA [Oscillospiraceae bacterium]|nr:helicase-exonuclease AddAB subunit AddA [Oscillospiraceae bacterium]